MSSSKSIKEVVNNDTIIVTKVLLGRNGKCRVDAKSRYFIPDQQNFFSKWCKQSYLNRLCREKYNKDFRDVYTVHY